MDGELRENEVVVTAYAVKYSLLVDYDDYIVVEQNRTRRRVYKGWYFDDNGVYVYISGYCLGMFQHKQKPKKYILNTVAKGYRDFIVVAVEKHVPERLEINDVLSIKELER